MSKADDEYYKLIESGIVSEIVKEHRRFDYITNLIEKMYYDLTPKKQDTYFDPDDLIIEIQDNIESIVEDILERYKDKMEEIENENKIGINRFWYLYP